MDIVTIDIINSGPAPSYATEESAGCDLYSTMDGTIKPGSRSGLIPTGIKLRIPPGYYCKINPRSGLAYRFGISVLGGVIDSDYRGEVFVILQNNGCNCYVYSKGDRIAQMVCIKYTKMSFNPVKSLDESTHTGFGSTGV